VTDFDLALGMLCGLAIVWVMFRWAP